MMKKLTEQELIENVEKFYGLIEKYLPNNERTSKLLEFYRGIETTLMTSPASTKLDFHNCFVGGYVDHVIRVTEAALVMDKVWNKFGAEKNYTTEELVFAAINHDLGKLGTNEDPFYIPQTSEWHQKNQGKYFTYNPKVTHMKIADRSLFYLQEAGIPVTENEYIAIKIHDGLFEAGNESYLMASSPEFRLKSHLPCIIHQADFMASRVENDVNKA
jgi:hypothetical protein